MKLNCQEANHICDKNQYREASLWDKIKLNIHLLYCRACRKYTVRNAKLTRVLKNPQVRTISTVEKNGIKEKIRRAQSK